MQQPIPPVVTSCIRLIEQMGLEKEGIFRKSGQVATIKQFKAEFDKGKDPLSGGLSNSDDIHAVAGLLKLYFRELPDPLISFSIYADLMQCMKMPPGQYVDCMLQLRKLLGRLPPANRDVLRSMLVFLHKVCEHQEVNKMRVHNLAIVFGPTLLRSPQDNVGAIITDSPYQLRCVTLCIQEHAWIFSDSDASTLRHVPSAVADGGHAGPRPMSPTDDVGVADDAVDVALGNGARARVLYDHTSESPGELSVREGDLVTILQRNADGWCRVLFDGQDGYLPLSYLGTLDTADTTPVPEALPPPPPRPTAAFPGPPMSSFGSAGSSMPLPPLPPLPPADMQSLPYEAYVLASSPMAQLPLPPPPPLPLPPPPPDFEDRPPPMDDIAE